MKRGRLVGVDDGAPIVAPPGQVNLFVQRLGSDQLLQRVERLGVVDRLGAEDQRADPTGQRLQRLLGRVLGLQPVVSAPVLVLTVTQMVTWPV